MYSINVVKLAILAITFTVIFTTSSVFADTDYSEMTDEELIDRFEKVLNTDVDLTMQDMMDKIKDGEMTDALAEELEQRMAEVWSESQGLVEELREITKELQKRGIDVEASVLTTDDSMIPMLTISKPILTNDVMSPRMQVKQGATSSDVICNDGLELVFKNSDNSPACVTSITAEKLIQRGWASS